MVVVRLSVAALVCFLIRWVAVLIIISEWRAGLLTLLLHSWPSQLGLPRNHLLLPWIHLLPKNWKSRQLAA